MIPCFKQTCLGRVRQILDLLCLALLLPRFTCARSKALPHYSGTLTCKRQCWTPLISNQFLFGDVAPVACCLFKPLSTEPISLFPTHYFQTAPPRPPVHDKKN